MGKCIWMHCASLGEFEQGRPLLEEIRQAYPDYKIVLTFFSPSGYEIRKGYTGADAVYYLPADNERNARRFVTQLDPALVLWVKYEYWFYYLTELKKKNIPVILVSGIFRESQPFFKWYGKMWREMLLSFHKLFVQDENSFSLVSPLHKNIAVAGDTRFDRVLAVKNNFKEVEWIRMFCKDKRVIVAGSTWEDDEAELIHFAKANRDVCLIIAPHEVHPENINALQKLLPHSILYSELASQRSVADNINVLIIDNIGMLSRLYFYADITYVGGGFNSSGIHNVLEAAAYGKPVIFGPVYEKFAEARGLVACGGGISINNALELEEALTSLFNNNDELASRSLASLKFVEDNAGATRMIMNYVAENRLLTR